MHAGRWTENKLLSEVTTFGVGGRARFFIEVDSAQDLSMALLESISKGIPYFILGKGSNVLFSDEGFPGLVILNKIIFFQSCEGVFDVGAGYSFSLLGTKTAKEGWGGLEFASGIPASVGGAIYMNAGANGKETAEHLRQVTYLTEKGDIQVYPKETLSFSYRHSSFQEMRGAIISATFALSKHSGAKENQLGIINYRKKTQPYSDKSAGCIFRNPEGEKAGALIEKCGLKGCKIGGAEVSSFHANFIVNKGGATAKDILLLIHRVQEVVQEKTGILLEIEVRLAPNAL